MKNIVVAGGGTAGWITALYAKTVFPNHNVTLIESEEVGILGAGEGSTPQLIDFLNFVNIPISDIIKHCDATIKNGIKFTGWKNDNSFYYHGFKSRQDVAFEGIDVSPWALSLHSSVLSAVTRDEDFKEINFSHKISELNKVPFIVQSGLSLDNSNVGQYSLHFNATKLAKRLSEIGIGRQIKRIEGKILDVEQDSDGNIINIVMENGTLVPSDFVFDCTGFHRLIIGKKLGSKWHSHSDYLPVNSALPFFIPMDEEIPPYTESIAMNYGWVWKIPLQNRYGCGYVYDSNFLSEEDAAKEVESLLGFEPEYPRKNKGSFKFNAGYYEEPWINNCIAIGLSGGFIEPLEATSIYTSILFLIRILNEGQFLEIKDQRYRDDFNKYFKKVNDEVVDFIYFHYMSDKKNTDFWKYFTYDRAPENIKKVLDSWEYRIPKSSELSSNIWYPMSWILVADGTAKLNRKMIKEYCQNSFIQKVYSSQYKDFKNYQNMQLEKYLHHNDLLGAINEV